MSEPSYEVYRPPARRVPEPPPETQQATYDEVPHRAPARRSRGLVAPQLGPGLMCVAIWAMTGGGYFWPMWVLLPAVIMTWTGGGRRRC